MSTLTLLVADIGGTSSRMAQASVDSDGPRTLTAVCHLPTRQVNSLSHLLEAARAIDPRLDLNACAAAVLAVPGPVEAQSRADLANVHWPVEIAPLRAMYPTQPVVLINDFVAQAYGCLTAPAAASLPIQAGRRESGAPLAVVGAGTGLGHGCLLPDGRGGYLPLASEAGHAAFAFVNRQEEAYRRFLRDAAGIEEPSADVVVSGQGLALLHRFLTREQLAPQEVAQRLTPQSETTIWFARFYARACRHYALAVLPRAGLFVAGGVAARNPLLVDNDSWRAEFIRSPAKQALLARIPVALITDTALGLWGAARYGAALLLGASIG
jgi:glucokinase